MQASDAFNYFIYDNNVSLSIQDPSTKIFPLTQTKQSVAAPPLHI